MDVALLFAAIFLAKNTDSIEGCLEQCFSTGGPPNFSYLVLINLQKSSLYFN